MNILVTGANGQLGSEIKKNKDYLNADFTFIDIAELDLTDETALTDFFLNNPFDYVINCAAYTDVDKAEEEIEHANMVNAYVPKYLAKLSAKFNFKLIHISTDFVFDGSSSKPYAEEDTAEPATVYGKTKLNGEKNIIRNCDDYMIIRTSWLYSNFGNNFVKTIQRLGKEKTEFKVVFDQIGTPTYAHDLSLAILQIIKTGFKPGIYHYSNEGTASWYDFALKIKELSGFLSLILPIETKDYPTPAERPHYSVLNKSKIKNTFNLNIRHWEEALKEAVEEEVEETRLEFL